MAHHDDVESVEAEDPREDSDVDAKEAIPTEEGKEIGREEDDEGEFVEESPNKSFSGAPDDTDVLI